MTATAELALTPVEHIAFLTARAQVGRGHNPGFATTAVLVETLARLSGLPGPEPVPGCGCVTPDERCAWCARTLAGGALGAGQ